MACALLFVLVSIVYSNSYKASWHFDDFPKIVKNPILKITNLKSESIIKTFSANRKDGLYLNSRIYRPLPALSFALNWYFGQLNLFGYHLVNNLLHVFTAIILFLTLLTLFRTPNLKEKYGGNEYFVALLTATLWAVNPIQTQAVTYIVQRSALMAALFYILGIYFYLKARMHHSRFKQIGFFVSCFLSYGCALASKANSVTLPIALILLEVIFFQDLSRYRDRKSIVWVLLGTCLGVVLFGVLFYLRGDPLAFLKSYDERFFTPLQRLMTQPRILLFYLSLIFYPAPTRLSIEHDITVSTSLFSPWTTLPSILVILFLIGFSILQIRRRPIFSFAILFFFLNHLIESSIIGLELIFEHRNYLPSLFVFFPVSVGIKWLLDYYRENKRSMYHIIVSFIILIIIGFGAGTFIRNRVWETEKTLWEDALKKAPAMARPYQNLAWAYYSRIGQYDKAKELLEKSIHLKMHSRHGKVTAINNMGYIFLMEGETDKASRLYEEAYRLYPQYGLYQFNLAKIREQSGDWQTALSLLDKILLKDPTHSNALSLKAQILLKYSRVEEAIEHFHRLLKLNTDDPFVMFNLGIAYRLLGESDRAQWYLKAAHLRDPTNVSILLWLIETHLVMGDRPDAGQYVQRLFASTPMQALAEAIHKIGEDSLMSDAARKMLIAEIATNLRINFQAVADLK